MPTDFASSNAAKKLRVDAFRRNISSHHKRILLFLFDQPRAALAAHRTSRRALHTQHDHRSSLRCLNHGPTTTTVSQHPLRSAILSRMGAPTYDAETLAAYFHPIRPETWDDPIVGPVLRRLAEEAPEVIEAVGDVDRSLIFEALTWTPEARVARALGMAAFIERTRESMGHGTR